MIIHMPVEVLHYQRLFNAPTSAIATFWLASLGVPHPLTAPPTATTLLPSLEFTHTTTCWWAYEVTVILCFAFPSSVTRSLDNVSVGERRNDEHSKQSDHWLHNHMQNALHHHAGHRMFEKRSRVGALRVGVRFDVIQTYFQSIYYVIQFSHFPKAKSTTASLAICPRIWCSSCKSSSRSPNWLVTRTN